MVYLPCDHVLLYVCYWVDHILSSTPYALCHHNIFVCMFQGRPHLVVYPTHDMSPHIVVRMFLGRPQNVVYPPCIMLPPIVLRTGVGRP